MQTRIVDDVVVIVPKGYFTGGKETEVLEQTISRHLTQGNRSLIVNLAKTKHMNNAALTVLMRAHSAYIRAGGQLKLCELHPRMRSVLMVTRLDLVFDIEPTEELALAAFAT